MAFWSRPARYRQGTRLQLHLVLHGQALALMAKRAGNIVRTVSSALSYDGERYPFEQYATFWTRENRP